MLVPEQRLTAALLTLPERPALAVGRGDAVLHQPLILVAPCGLMARGCSEQHLSCALLFGIGGPLGLGLSNEPRAFALMDALT